MQTSIILKQNILRLMHENCINQAELARRAKLTETPISRYINGSRFPSSKSLLKLSKALNCGVDDLIKSDIPNEFERIITKAFSTLSESEREYILSKLKN